MTNETVLSEVVWAWAADLLPGQQAAADGAAAMARQALADGATVAEACHTARAFVRSWSSHPAHRAEELRLVG